MLRSSRGAEVVHDQVAILSQSTGSPHTAAIADQLVEDNIVTIPLTWYSGWPDPELGQNVFESYTSYCVDPNERHRVVRRQPQRRRLL